MSEPRIQKKAGALDARPKGRNVGSTLFSQPKPEAIRAFQAMIRKDLRELRGT